MTTSRAPISWQQLPHAPEAGTCIGNLHQLADGQAIGTRGAFPVLLLRSGDTVFAYANRCPHFGVPLSSEQGLLHQKAHESISCSVHLAKFRWTDGRCTWGDCEGEFLSVIPVEVDFDGDGAIRIKKTI